MSASACSAAAIDPGLALYESSITVTPSARVKTSILRVETSRRSARAAATSVTVAPSSSATAAAARVLPT
jgi:hypothetical protein